MNTKPLTLLAVGTLGLAAGFGMCWVLSTRCPSRVNSDQGPVAQGGRVFNSVEESA